MRRWGFSGAGALGAAAAVLIPVAAEACAVCWGSSGGSHRTDWALLFLMAMPFTIVGSIGGWLIYRYRRPSKGNLQQTAPGQKLSTTLLTNQESPN